MRERVRGRLILELRCSRRRRDGRTCGDLLGAFSETAKGGVQYLMAGTTPSADLGTVWGTDRRTGNFIKQTTWFMPLDMDEIADGLPIACRRCRFDVLLGFRDDMPADEFVLVDIDALGLWPALALALATGEKKVIPYALPDEVIEKVHPVR